jgi:ArsR family metal-binding transcriptional regulator
MMMETDHASGGDQLITCYSLELIAPPCVPGADKWSTKAHLDVDITEVLPYLNAELEGAEYYHESKILTWRDGTRKYAFRPHELAVALAADREEAKRLIDQLVSLVNDIWSHRNEIEPSYQRKELPSLMQIYKLLPRTNCKECGRSTCMAFAADLREGRVALSRCPQLSGENRDKFSQLFSTAP